MTTQTQTTTLNRLEFVVYEESAPSMPAQYTAYDFGYELDADEVGEALAIEYSNGSFDGPAQPATSDELEATSNWFIS